MLTQQGLNQYSQDPFLIKGHALAPDIGAWIFNRGQGTTIPDLAGNNRICRIVGSPSRIRWKAKPITEGGGWCITSTSGNGDQSTLLPKWRHFSLPVTVTMIIKGPAVDGYVKGIYSSSYFNGIYQGIWVSIPSDNTVLASIGDGTGQLSTDRRSRSSSLALTAGKLYIITCVFKSTTDIDIYINGVLKNGALSGTGGNLAWYTDDIGGKIGFIPNTISDGGYTSDIHAVYVYNRALTPAQAAWQAMDPYAPFTQANTYHQFAQGLLSPAIPKTYIAATVFG